MVCHVVLASCYFCQQLEERDKESPVANVQWLAVSLQPLPSVQKLESQTLSWLPHSMHARYKLHSTSFILKRLEDDNEAEPFSPPFRVTFACQQACRVQVFQQPDSSPFLWFLGIKGPCSSAKSLFLWISRGRPVVRLMAGAVPATSQSASRALEWLQGWICRWFLLMAGFITSFQEWLPEIQSQTWSFASFSAPDSLFCLKLPRIKHFLHFTLTHNR